MSLLPESVQIYVDEKCIKNGVIGDAKHCPVALACKKYLPRNVVKFIGPLTMEIGGRNIISPKEVKLFIMAFDKGLDVEPFDFTLDLTKIFDGDYSIFTEPNGD